MGREILFKAKSGVSGKWVEGLAFNACNMQYIYTCLLYTSDAADE